MVVLANILDAIVSRVSKTTKDIYDRSRGEPPALFGSQNVVDELVDEIATEWDLQQSDLGIVDT